MTQAEMLAGVQTELRSIYGPGHYYTEKYSHEEALYFGRIPFWLTAYINSLPATAQVCDVGCAYGTLAAVARFAFPGVIYAVDCKRYISEQVTSKFRIHYYERDVERQDLYLENLDAIILTEVLEHFNFHPFPTMLKLRRMLKRNGRLYLSTPDAKSWGRTGLYKSLEDIPQYAPGSPQQPWYDGHVWQYTEDELHKLLKDVGFTIIRQEKSQSPGGEHFNIEAGN